MRYAIAASALLGAVAAAPQMINIDAALAVPTPTILGPKVEETKAAPISYNPTVAASAVAVVVKEEGVIEKRVVADSCGAQLPGGVGQVPGDGSVSAYLDKNGDLRKAAQAATADTAPSGYTQSFQDLTGSSQQVGYLTYKNLDTYSPQACADFCDSEKYCQGFNVYFERDPKFEPKDGCANPPAVTNIKCSIYGYNVAAKAATNDGQWRGPQDANGESFHVVITGSNGYSKNSRALPSITDFNAGEALPAAINAPLDNGYDTYNGMRLFNNNPYDPALCAAACEAQTEYDVAHPAADGSYKACNFFTSYVLTKNDVPLGTYCALYTRSWDRTYAVNTGFFDGDDVYSVRNAASYALTNFKASVKPTAQQ
ncbi:hypothetical protein C7974DRAFT_91965 [Boeremia exigua]|uniref:uncharacterized protein n=1 Tax=Boeremia exigua TaxID=749465 RepID=UPI001E8E74DF|nr:uncharacterized protein C7974DRAFT_91965 [Boeremia exigua]KAH6612148.1 hypothetical protein C7974DRAFT_91965 [Boeremia exigua]